MVNNICIQSMSNKVKKTYKDSYLLKNYRRRIKLFFHMFIFVKWLLLVVSCSALEEGFIKGHEKLGEEMKEPRVWVGACLGERMPNVTQGRKFLSSDVHFGPLSTPASLPNLFFALYCLSCLIPSLFCPVLSSQIDRQ